MLTLESNNMKKPDHISAKRWCSPNSNIYFSCVIYFDDDSEQVVTNITQGSGEEYLKIAIEWLILNGYINQNDWDDAYSKSRFIRNILGITSTIRDVKRKKDLE